MSAGARKKDHFDEHGIKIRSQHSIFGPVKRVAGPPGERPRWRDSVERSWTRFERKDEIRRSKHRADADADAA